jgi:pantetheine-phosphate adenylyltransferase
MLQHHTQRRAVYAGSFDPITNGHLWMIREAARLFDELIVAIGVNPEKRTLFSVDDRLQMIRDATSDLRNVRIASYENMFLVKYARKVDAPFIVRGIRNEVDYGFERGMRHVNGELSAEILTVFLMPPRDLSEISSSFVKGLIGPEGWQEIVSRYVPTSVFTRLVHDYEKAHAGH